MGYQPAQIRAPAPFLNCTYNESQVFYNGKVQLANKQQRYQLKIYGIIFPYYLQSICTLLKQQVKRQSYLEEKELEVQLRADEHSKLFSHKKNLKTVKLSTKNGYQPYKVMFN